MELQHFATGEVLGTPEEDVRADRHGGVETAAFNTAVKDILPCSPVQETPIACSFEESIMLK